MAEGGGYHQVHLRAAKKPACDLCTIEQDIQLWKCLDCNIYLCEQCVTRSHKKIPGLKNHTIISRVERDNIKISNISKLCLSHPDDEVIYHCSTCNDLICAECVIKIHKKHEFTKIKDFAKQKRKNLITHINAANNEVIPKMTQQIDELKEKIKINDKHKEDISQKVQNRIKNMISELEKVGKKMEAECINHHQKNEDNMETKQTNLTKDVSEIQTMSRDFNKIYNTGSDIEVIRAEQEIAEKLTHLKADNPPNMDTEDLPIFIEGKTDNKILKTMFGCLQSGPRSSKAGVGVINQFKHKSEIVRCICPLADNTAVIHYHDLYDNDIVTTNGQLQQTMRIDSKVVDFALTSDSDILYISGSDPTTIYKLTNGVVTDTISTAPLQPVCLCESRDGNLLVSLVDEWSLYNIKKSSRRRVSRITMKGKVLQSYEYNKGSRLFTWPFGVSENINGDVCVVNNTSITTGHLVILTSEGQLKSTYNGQQLKYEFYPVYVKCDTVGNILVNDFHNKNVHMLNSQCQFVRYVLTENKLSDRPWTLAVDNKTGVLWVGGFKGHIYTTKYLE